ncbi:hypothetical protein TSARBOMBA_172 [Bacillus phage TsarBomba]|uniref:Uncharacterized protein n=1 Tax=Bacillus phage TsarBomba TaxID=1690456 RepID=A0A0K2D0S8_9CAUD|nr:hypothetical protein TSARBOMBA_172 [Bacillus phage TsarBomba]ALA13206.1 hypothetical protein TSARBOMBA_172 [Bacillus phage TsarBomba]
MKKFYESDIKELILNKRHLFLSNKDSKSTVVFEKGIAVGSTIADCLIFSEEGIIGIEIKTERDTTRRLNKQLQNYSLICDKVYVMCHDNHVEKVEAILSKNNWNHVGILAYTEFRGEAILGLYKAATRSPFKKVFNAYQMLWKEEINNILGSFKRQMKTLEEFGINVNMVESRSGGLNGLYVQSNASKKYLKKSQMIGMIISRLGEAEANKLLCNIFISGKMHPEKQLKFYHFRKKS